MKKLLLCFPQAIRSRKRRRDSRFHYLYGYVRHTWPGPEVWLVLRRHSEPGELQASLCHAPGDTALEQLVPMSGRRWPIETCVEDRKQRLGMGDDAGRSWTGWHHHRTWIILAHFFVVRMSLR